jgi:predicted nucleic acid-binding protein
MNLLDDIPPGAVVGLDTAPIIYYLEAYPDWGPLVRPLFDARVLPGANTAVTSTITLAEVLVKPLQTARADLVTAYRAFLTSSPHLALEEITPAIAERAADLRACYGLRLPDACQVAVALAAKAALLVTNDAQMRRVTELRVLMLKDYLTPPAPPPSAPGPVP